MAYDSPHYTLGPIFGSFASFTCTAANKTGTTANIHDRIEFFRKIKLKGIKFLTRASGAAGARAFTKVTPKFLLTDGTNVLATCVCGTVAGVGTSGGINSTYSSVDADEELQIRLKLIQDGTATTTVAVSADMYIEYQDR